MYAMSFSIHSGSLHHDGPGCEPEHIYDRSLKNENRFGGTSYEPRTTLKVRYRRPVIIMVGRLR